MSIRQSIYDLINKINPHDLIEDQHKEYSLQWVKSANEIFRIHKPNIPEIHLVSYFVLYDPGERKILLGDHKLSQLWLPSGGHVDKDEFPVDTVRRECLEELKAEAVFIKKIPLFITVTEVTDHNIKHTDVSLWFLLKAQEGIENNFCENEYNQMKWFKFNDIPYQKSDRHMERFIDKLSKELNYIS